MTTTQRRTIGHPSFKPLQSDLLFSRIPKEIIKLKPKIEVTLEGFSEVHLGKIQEWHLDRKFFSVLWDLPSESLAQQIDSVTHLRVFFKVKLFSTQLIFKTIALRRLDATCFHFRIPEEVFEHQLRATLRVPVQTSSKLSLKNHQGVFKILDLSSLGAKIEVDSSFKVPATLKDLKFSVALLSKYKFDAKVVSSTKATASTESRPTRGDPIKILGLKFLDFPKEAQSLLKQVLVNELHQYYKELK